MAVSNSLHLAGRNLKRIHVNQANLRKKVKGESGGPCYTIKSGCKTYWAKEVSIYGISTLVERVENPLGCGARLWLETYGEICLWDYEEPN
jgi:hypothetical protein